MAGPRRLEWCFFEPEKGLSKNIKWRPVCSLQRAYNLMLKNGQYSRLWSGTYREYPTSLGLLIDFGAQSLFGLVRNRHADHR